MDRNFRVAVVGAGAIGLSTALHIQDRIRNCDVTIIADKFSPSTTSDGSAGLWTPFIVPDKQKEIIKQVFNTSVWKITGKVTSFCQLCNLLPVKMQNKSVWQTPLKIIENVHFRDISEKTSNFYFFVLNIARERRVKCTCTNSVLITFFIFIYMNFLSKLRNLCSCCFSRWALQTYRYLWDMFHSEDAYQYGVQLISGFNFCQEMKNVNIQHHLVLKLFYKTLDFL